MKRVFLLLGINNVLTGYVVFKPLSSISWLQINAGSVILDCQVQFMVMSKNLLSPELNRLNVLVLCCRIQSFTPIIKPERSKEFAEN